MKIHKHFYGAQEISEILSCSVRTAQSRIRGLNEELAKKGFVIERGKIPIKYFHERYPVAVLEGNSKENAG